MNEKGALDHFSKWRGHSKEDDACTTENTIVVQSSTGRARFKEPGSLTPVLPIARLSYAAKAPDPTSSPRPWTKMFDVASRKRCLVGMSSWNLFTTVP